MPRKINLLHVRTHLVRIIESIDSMLKRDGKYENGTRLAPIDKQELYEIVFFSEAILRKHASKKTRKDIYVER
jgi:hypothetical protein